MAHSPSQADAKPVDEGFITVSDQGSCSCGNWNCPTCQPAITGPYSGNRYSEGWSQPSESVYPPNGRMPAGSENQSYPSYSPNQSAPQGDASSPIDRGSSAPASDDFTSSGDVPQAADALAADANASAVASAALSGADSSPFQDVSADSTSGTEGVPSLVGDFFGSGGITSVISDVIPYSIQADGFIIGGGPGSPGSSLVYETGGQPSPNDFFSVGTGLDANNDGFADTFAISEPVPPSDAPTSPGPGFQFDGGSATNPTGTFQDGDPWQVNYSFSRPVSLVLPNPATSGAVVGRAKLAENNSPLPRDRIFFNYSYFDNVPLTSRGVSVNRFTPGIEKTFWRGQMSFELRTPFASTLDSNITFGAPSASMNTEFGNVFAAYKLLLYNNGAFATSTGLSVTAPTADGLRVTTQDGRRLVEIDNGSVHVMPYFGWVARSQGYFTQGMLQVDIDTRGNPVRVNETGRGLQSAGYLQDVMMLYLDVSAGRIFRLDRAFVTQVAPLVELHYNRSLQSTDSIATEKFRIGERKEDIQVINALAAVNVVLRDRSDVTVGYATPIGYGSDQGFDGELRILWNYQY